MMEETNKKTEETNKKVENEKKFDKNDNVIFIGSKPLVNYIRGIVSQFTRRDAEEVVIKSRGKFISKAVDVAEVARRSLEEHNVSVKGISIASESFETEGKKTNISTMDIVLGKG